MSARKGLHSLQVIKNVQKHNGLQCFWRKAGRSLKGFGFVPEVTACALTVGFSVRRVRAPLIDLLGFLAEGRWPGGRPVLP